MNGPLLSIEGVSKEFESRGKRVLAVDSVDLSLAEGEFVTIVGPSGCGKSTLLNLVVGLVRPTNEALNRAESRLLRWRPRAEGPSRDLY